MRPGLLLQELMAFTSSEPSVPHQAFQDGITAVLNQVHDVDYPAALKLVSQPALSRRAPL